MKDALWGPHIHLQMWAFKVSYALTQGLVFVLVQPGQKPLGMHTLGEPLGLGRGTCWKVAQEGDPMKMQACRHFPEHRKAVTVGYTNNLYSTWWAPKGAYR